MNKTEQAIKNCNSRENVESFMLIVATYPITPKAFGRYKKAAEIRIKELAPAEDAPEPKTKKRKPSKAVKGISRKVKGGAK